ncbi:DUF3159 domain-containing protein [Nocardia heshunensis]
MRSSNLLVAAAPTVVFVAVNAATSLTIAVITAAATAIAGFGYQLLRRKSLWHALFGLLIVAACAAVAIVTGQAKGFFVVPALITGVIVVVCTATIAARRPLSGLLLNRISGGPPDWYTRPRLRRVHVVATWLCAAVDVLSLALTAVFYLTDNTVALGTVHLANAPVFAAIVAATLVRARRVIADPA